MSYGILPTGFNKKTISEIETSILNRLREFFGNDIDLTGMNPVVKFSESISEEIANVWEMLEATYNAIFPVGATGILADLHANMRGGSRKPAITANGEVTFVKASSETVVIPSGTIVDNGLSGASLVQYTVDDSVSMLSTAILSRGSAGLTDYFVGQSSTERIFDAKSIVWISDSPNGSPAYVSGTDYVAYVSGDDAITWITGHGPTAGSYYYVKILGYSEKIAVTCTVAGVIGNVLENELNHLPTPITGISSVFNTDAITNGTDIESDIALDTRTMLAPWPQVNWEDIQAFVVNLELVRAAKVIEHLGWFETVVATWNTPTSKSDYDSIVNSIVGYKMAGQAPCHLLSLTKGTTGGKDYFPTDTVYTNIHAIGAISDHQDLSNPYVELADYLAYNEGTDFIDWSPAGNEPTTGHAYFVQLFPAITLAYETKIWIRGKITLKSGSNLATINNNVLDAESVYFNSLGVNENVLREKVASIIVGSTGVASLENFRFRVTLRVFRSTSGEIDWLPFVFVNEAEAFTMMLESAHDPDFHGMNSNEDGSGTAYAPTAPPAYDGGGSWLPGHVGIDWTGASSYPPAGSYYYVVGGIIDNDIYIGTYEIAKLEGVDLT